MTQVHNWEWGLAERQARQLLWKARVGIFFGGAFGAFVIVVCIALVATNPPDTFGALAVPATVASWAVALLIAVLIRRRYMPLPSRITGDAMSLTVRSWLALFVLTLLFAIPLCTMIGPSLTSSTGAALGLAIATICLFAGTRWSAGKVARLVRGESASAQPARAKPSATGDRAKAEALYQEARKHMQVGGVKAEAVRLLTAAIAADATLADAYDARSNVYSSMGRGEEALADIEKCGQLKKAGNPTTRDNTIGGLPQGLDDILKRSGL